MLGRPVVLEYLWQLVESDHGEDYLWYGGGYDGDGGAYAVGAALAGDVMVHDYVE